MRPAALSGIRLLRGMSPEALASVVTLGLVLGVFPAPVLPTLLCGLAAFALRLNPPAIQLVNYLAYPLQIALAAPFVTLGRWLFRAAPVSAVARHGVRQVAAAIGTAAAHAIAAWFCVCAPLGLLLYLLLASALRRREPIGAGRRYCSAKAMTLSSETGLLK